MREVLKLRPEITPEFVPNPTAARAFTATRLTFFATPPVAPYFQLCLLHDSRVRFHLCSDVDLVCVSFSMDENLFSADEVVSPNSSAFKFLGISLLSAHMRGTFTWLTK